MNRVELLMYKKFNLNDFKITQHALQDRENRIVDILSTCGFGDVIKIMPSGENAYRLLTTTKVTIILNKDLDTVVTLYKTEDCKYRKQLIS